MLQQIIVLITIVASLVLFIKGRLRYDVVAVLALMVVTISGVIEPHEAFLGFGNPVVITVAAVLIISKGLINVGAADILVKRLESIEKSATLQVAGLTAMTAIFSGFMNNIGALALIMPVAVKMAKKNNTPTSTLLMPIAFGSLLGGMITLIGTPPNIIIATYRIQAGLEPFGMFDFSKVGIGIAAIGIIYITLLGWRLIPSRKNSNPPEELFKIEDYITELCIPQASTISGKSIMELSEITASEVNILSIIRNKKQLFAPTAEETIQAGDILIVQTDTVEFRQLVEKTNVGLPIFGCSDKVSREMLSSIEYSLVEAVVRDDSPLVGETPKTLQLRPKYGVNLVAISRQGERFGSRLRSVSFKAGDIILFQAKSASLQETIEGLKCLPLAERAFRLTSPIDYKKVSYVVISFGIAILFTSLGLLTPQVAFTAAALFMVLGNIISTKELYESIEWPIIVLLGALLPVGEALEKTGASTLIASLLLKSATGLSPVVAIIFLMLATVLLTNVINNAAAAVLMAPIAISIAEGLGASVDPFLMVVAIGASSAFLTPIGHQSNTLVMGPGGYHFKDYWRMGLPLTILVALVGIPLILVIWPL